MVNMIILNSTCVFKLRTSTTVLLFINTLSVQISVTTFASALGAMGAGVYCGERNKDKELH